LSQSIPKELGKLANLELFDLSDNRLSGQIPSELDNLQDASIHLSGNLDMSSPAPPELCSTFRMIQACAQQNGML